MKKWGHGIFRIRIIGADLMHTMDLLLKSGISAEKPFWKDPLTLECEISAGDWETTEQICAKQGDSLQILGKWGFCFFLTKVLRRPVLIAGMIILLMCSLILPRRVFFVRVEGNISVPDRRILEAASDTGICFGASRAEVRSEKVKNALLHRVPQLQWAGVNTRGCVAVISVRERIAAEEKQEDFAFGHIVALRDGVITSCTALSGTLLVAPGQAVEEGDILISGYTACDLCIRTEQAQGEIFARTIRPVSGRLPENIFQQGNVKEIRHKISLRVGKKRINLWKDSGISDATCDRMYEEYYVTLPGEFQLPLALSVERFVLRQIRDETIDPEQCRQNLQESARSYIQHQMISGMIVNASLDYTRETTAWHVNGRFLCTEMIGVMQRQQIGEKHGKSD